jgi:hypothetical protein
VISTEKISASCHCGAVRFEMTLKDGFNTIRRCNCSFCRMRGAIAVSAKLSDIRVVSGEEKLTLYQFNTKSAKHYFCSVCGIYTHHQRRSKPDEFGVNVSCLDGVSPFDFETVPVLDGTNHPKDGGILGSVVGVLRFERTKC